MIDEKIPAANRVGAWALWAFTALGVFLTAFAGSMVAGAARAHYLLNRMDQLPILTGAALALADSLWVVATLSAAIGAWQAYRQPERAVLWSLLTILLCVCCAAVIAGGLALPFQLIQGPAVK